MTDITIISNGRVLLGRSDLDHVEASGPSFWRRLGSRLYAALETSGRRRAARALLLADRRMLEQAGISRAELEAILR